MITLLVALAGGVVAVAADAPAVEVHAVAEGSAEAGEEAALRDGPAVEPAPTAAVGLYVVATWGPLRTDVPPTPPPE